MDWCGVTGRELGLGLESKTAVSAMEQSPNGSIPPRAELQFSPIQREVLRYGAASDAAPAQRPRLKH